MWPVVLSVLRRYVPYITLPFAGVVGYLGYHVEGWISDRYTPATASINEQREERLLENIDNMAKTRKKHSPLDFNLSPSLSS